MRIIAGEFRGRKLLTPERSATRPVTDRVKQSIFDILTPRIDGARVYDLFAGTGSLGLEALSRGAAHVTFFESDRSALARLRKNIDALGVRRRSTVVAGDLFEWFHASRHSAVASCDIVFLDPPYRFLHEKSADLQRLLQELAAYHLHPQSVVVFRHAVKDTLVLPALSCFDRRSYGSMDVEFCIPTPVEQPPASKAPMA